MNCKGHTYQEDHASQQQQHAAEQERHTRSENHSVGQPLTCEGWGFHAENGND